MTTHSATYKTPTACGTKHASRPAEDKHINHCDDTGYDILSNVKTMKELVDKICKSLNIKDL